MSTRHPPNKLLLKLNKSTVIERTLSIFIDFPLDINIITGHQQDKINDILKKFKNRITIIQNPDFRSGMASSIKCGLHKMQSDCEYIGICPGDKPFIEKKTVKSILLQMQEKHPLIAAPSYDGRLGHPCFFAGALGNELLKITGDTGGKMVIEKYRDHLLEIPVRDKGVIMDMDMYLDGIDVR